ncbi:MAG: cysteine--tRNA ligase [Candidatus Dojkabacteria bacterium]|nr:MAG: cysteine--tRNA ligase [Candidatus Dojkabacteria bacterium]
MELQLYNTLTRQKELVKPRHGDCLKMYNCGPTVYSRQHIGNYRAFAEWDVLHRSLLYLGYCVERVTNITDVGHMTTDEDFGEDKMDKAAAKSGKQPIDIANEVIDTFLEDLSKLNIRHPDGTEIDLSKDNHTNVADHSWTRATDYIEAMVDSVKKIEEAGLTYETEQAVYFDVTKYDKYTELSRQKLDEKEIGVRDEVAVDTNKKHPADFVLWMKLTGKYANHIMHWPSPWGEGFPGWHIECTAMGCAELGDAIDIHTGGIEHIPVHHTNERAQNFGAFGHDVVDMWVHNEHLVGKKGAKMSKSLGNIYTIPELVELGYDPLDLRYYYLTVKYNQPLYFSLEGLDSAKDSRISLQNKITHLASTINVAELDAGRPLDEYLDRFKAALNDDLNKPVALAVLSDLLKIDAESADLLATVRHMDEVLGLRLIENAFSKVEITEELQSLMSEREAARANKDYSKSDEVRDKLKSMGYEVLDKPDGSQELRKI